MKKKYYWGLFDGRFRTDEDRAICYEVCDTLGEAKQSLNDYGGETVLVEMEVEGDIIINTKILN